jgi:peroxiredoxin
MIMIKVGDKLPEGTLGIHRSRRQCCHRPTLRSKTSPKQDCRDLRPARRGCRPFCQARSQLPGHADALKAKGVSDIICMSVNDAFVMGAWARDQKTGGKVRMMADGSADFTKKLGLELDLTARGMGVRCQRFSMLVVDGVVKTLNVEGPGKFEVSDGATMLTQAG